LPKLGMITNKISLTTQNVSTPKKLII
jgi:hypothetical protein